MARYRRRVSGKFVASAVAAGLILAVAQGHGHPGGGVAGALTVAASGASNEALANSRPPPGTGGPAARRHAWTTCGPRSPRAPGPRP